MAAHILAPIAQLNTALLTTLVHPSFFPYPLLSTLHAGRVSLVHRALSRSAYDKLKLSERKQITWAYDLAGFLIMAWGGAFLTSFILGQPPIQLLSIRPLVNYASVHYFLMFAFQFISPPTAKTVDTTMVLIDGVMRMQAVIGSIGLAVNSSHAAIRGSLLIQVLLGTVGATGGGQLAGFLGIHSPLGWSLQTPPVLRATSIVEVIDVWMAFICSLLYGVTTLSHPSYSPALAVFYDNGEKPLFSPLGARAACSLVFAAGFAYRATVLHWLSGTKVDTKVKVNGNTKSIAARR
ncbi:hypothetical protein CBS101457_003215 [Exobasidium rhododendri]|nr:hypothetical protein CBS101457_003215 [Exobasidium rhododendri]